MISVSGIIGAAVLLIIFTAMQGAVFNALASAWSSSNIMTKALLAVFPVSWLFISLLSIFGTEEATDPQNLQRIRERRRFQ